MRTLDDNFQQEQNFSNFFLNFQEIWLKSYLKIQIVNKCDQVGRGVGEGVKM